MRIVVISGPEACGPFLLREGDNLVGRESTCVVSLPSKRVSRRHATLRVDRGQVMVVDEGSQNGVLDARGQRISNRALAARERFQVGDYVLGLDVEATDEEIDLEDDANDPPTDEVALQAAEAAASWGGGGDPLRNASPRVAGSDPRNAPAPPPALALGASSQRPVPTLPRPGGPRADAFPPLAAPRSASPAPWPPPPSGAPAAPPPSGPPSAGARPRMPMKPGAAPFTAPPRPAPPPRIGDPDPEVAGEQSLTPVAPTPVAPPLPPPRPVMAAPPAASPGQAGPPPPPPFPRPPGGFSAPPSAPQAFQPPSAPQAFPPPSAAAPAAAPPPAWGPPSRSDSAPVSSPTHGPSHATLTQRAPWWALVGGSLAATMGGFLLVAGLQVQGAAGALQEASLLRAEEIADALGNRNASAIAEQRGLAYDVAFVSDRAGVRGAMLADARGMVLAPTDKLRTSVTAHGAWKEAAQARRAARAELDDGVWEVVTPVRADIGGSGARTVVGYAIVEYDPRVVVDAVYTPGLRWFALVAAALAASGGLTAAGWFLVWRPLHHLRDETEFAIRGAAPSVHAPSSLPPFTALAHSINRLLARIPRGGAQG